MTVVGTRRRLDADLPDSIPVAELMGDVVALLGENQNGAAVEWGLLKVGGTRLDPELSLGDQGVADGTMLFLRDVTIAPVAPDVDDFAGHVAAAVDVQKGRWSAAMPAALVSWIAASALAAGGLVVLIAGDASSRATAGVLGAVIGGLAAVTVARVLGRRDLAEVLMLGSLPSWAAAGAGIVGLFVVDTPMTVGWGLAFVAAGGLIAGNVAGDAALAPADGVVEATVVPAFVVVIADVFGAGLAQAAAALVVVELVMLATTPPVTSRLLASLDLARGRAVASASRIASAVVIVSSCAVLAASGGWFARGLVAATAIATILRARHFRFTGEVAPLLIAGIASLILLELPLAGWLALGARGAAGLAMLLTADAFLLVAAAVVVRRWTIPAPLLRWLRPLEFTAVAITVPLALGAFGLYDAVAHYASTLH